MVSMSVGDLTALRIALLGLVSADRDGQPLPIGPPRRRAVLAVLAPCRHHAMPTPTGVDAVPARFTSTRPYHALRGAV